MEIRYFIISTRPSTSSGRRVEVLFGFKHPRLSVIKVERSAGYVRQPANQRAPGYFDYLSPELWKFPSWEGLGVGWFLDFGASLLLLNWQITSVHLIKVEHSAGYVRQPADQRVAGYFDYLSPELWKFPSWEGLGVGWF